MLVEYTTHPQFVSNTYLVADGFGGPAFFIDAGGPVEPLIEAAERLGLKPTHVLLTHHHFDHVSEVGTLRAHGPKLAVLISARERDLLTAAAQAAGEGSGWADGVAELAGVEAGQTLQFGTLEVRPLHTPGHTAGMLSFLVGDRSETGGQAQGRPATTTAPGGFSGGGAYFL
jgi:hydroxyacylglutathione hydrolase